ncbi:hypothetical protein ABZ714_11520 [Streptomyces sp. NPDC006798]|uniref:hypothetical protein n=1 Tax=Streptomyces sp. NPDC006798 TaxID=3155462 RepID=UPI0033F87DC5
MIPDSIEFPEAARYILFVLLGELPLQASSDMAFSSSIPYEDKAGQVLDLRSEIADLLNKVDGALPPQVAASFKEALAPLTGAGGQDLLGELAGQISQVSDNRIRQSQKIMESKYEIIAEALILLAELAIIAALSFFTGGLSFSQAATAKARTTVAVLTIMQRLLNQTHLLPALSEAVQEALTTLAVRLAMLTLNDGPRRPDGIDGRDILKSLAVGGLAGFFGSGISDLIGDIFKRQFRNFGDNKWGVFGGNVFRNAASEGPSEAFAEFLVNGLFDNRWKFDLLSMAGGSLSAVTEMILSGALDHIAKGLNSKFFDGRNVFTTYNPPPGPDTVLGGGGGSAVVHTPRTTPDTTVTTVSSDGPRSVPGLLGPTPPPVRTSVPPVVVPPAVVPPLVTGGATPVNTLSPELLTGGVDPYRTDGPPPGGSSPYSPGGQTGSRETPLVTPPVNPPDPGDSRDSGNPVGPVQPGRSVQPVDSSRDLTSPGPGTTGSPVVGPAPGTTPAAVTTPAAPDRGATVPSVNSPSPTTSPSTTSPSTAAPASGGRPDVPGSRGTQPEDASQEETRTAPEAHENTGRRGSGSPVDAPAVPAPPPTTPTTPNAPTTEPVRSEQWRPRQDAAPSTVVRTVIPAGPEAGGTNGTDGTDSARGSRTADGTNPRGTSAADDGSTTVATEVRRVQADDGRWVRALSLDVPVRPGPGLAGLDLDDLRERVRVLLDTEVNHGLSLPRSGDQLHIDLSVLIAPGAAGAVEISAADHPGPSTQRHIRLYGDDPGLAPAERERRRADNAVTVLRQLLRRAGLTPTADPATGPLVTPEALRTTESVTDTTTAAGPDLLPPVVRPSLESDGPGFGPKPATARPDRPRPIVTALALPSDPDADSGTDSESESESDSGSESESESGGGTESRPVRHSDPAPQARPEPEPQPTGLIVKHHPDYMLTVGSGVGRLLHGLGHPALLAGDARARVQFGNPRPLLTVDFEVVANGLPDIDVLRRELERLPGDPVVTVPVQNRPGAVLLTVNGVDIRLTVGTPPRAFATAPGFTLPSPPDSLADAALALATAPDRTSRDEALFDLLWTLGRAPAEGPPAAALIDAREDAYRAAAPPGAAPSLAVQLSELLDAALDPDALHQHEVLWADNEADEDDESLLTEELTTFAAELRSLPQVTADPVRVLARRIPGMTGNERTHTIARLTPDHRERLANTPALIDTLRDTLTHDQFATTAADLIIQIPDGVHQPTSAREAAREQVARLLRDPVVTARLVKLGSRVVVVPRDRPVTSLDAFKELEHRTGPDGRCFHTMRGVATLHAAVSEENLLGEHTTIGAVRHLPDGYSATFHEVSHIVHRVGLDFADLGLINHVFQATTTAGEAGAWPDGALYVHDTRTGRRRGPNYSSLNQYEFFAQLTNVYLRANTGNDPVTGGPRENGGPKWVEANHPDLYRLLLRLYGPGPERSLKANPVVATQGMNEGLAGARALLNSDTAREIDSDTDTGLASDSGSDSGSDSDSDSDSDSGDGSGAVRGTGPGPRDTTAAPRRAGLYPPLAVPTRSVSSTESEESEESAGAAVPPHPNPVLEVGQYVALALRGLGAPAVLSGTARDVVQFDNPRPLNAVDFRLVAARPPAADRIRAALERELPDARIDPLPAPDGDRAFALSVDGVTVRFGVGDPPAATVTADGFTLPAPAGSLAEAALALATGTDRDRLDRDLLDLLWAASRTPADGPRAAALLGPVADAYLSVAPPGAAPSVAVRLSELLDAALDPDALAGHERIWTALGVEEADLPGLRTELSALAAELRSLPEVTADPVRVLARRIPGMTGNERTHTIARLTPDHRERLANTPALIDTLRDTLTHDQFATTAADLIIQIPDGVHQPTSARMTARTEIARLLRNPDIAARLVKGGSRIVVVPRDRPMTDLDAFKDLKGLATDDGRPWDEVRGMGRHSAAVTEENLLGEQPEVGDEEAYPDGYSTTLHEVAHTIHLHVLDAADRLLITEAFEATDELGEDGAWPDGALYGYDEGGERSLPNYSSLNENEFFAQLTNVYLRANSGNDQFTGLPRNNGGPKWVERNQPGLYPLLLRLYGPGPERPAAVNPVHATGTENEALARARALWDVAGGEPGEGGDAYDDMRKLWEGPRGDGRTGDVLPPGGGRRKYEGVRALWHAATGSHQPQGHPEAPAPTPGGRRRRAARALWQAATGGRSRDPAAAPPAPLRPAPPSAAVRPETPETPSEAPVETGETPVAVEETPGPADLPELSAYARSYGTDHDGQIGLVLFERTPRAVLDGLYRQITDALGIPGGTPDATAVRNRLAGLLTAEDVEEHRPRLRDSGGHRITVRHGNRDRTVDIRFLHRDTRHSARYYGAGQLTPPDARVERRAEGAQGFTATEDSGTYRTLVLPWSLNHSVGSGPLRWGDITVTTSLTHNQLTQSITVGETFQINSKHFAKEPARPLDLDALWQIRVDAADSTDNADNANGTDTDTDDGWSAARSHGPLTGWFPEHRAVGDGTGSPGPGTTTSTSRPARLPEPGPLDDLPLWGVESLARPGRLLAEVLAAPAFPELRALGTGSAQALDDFFAEIFGRGTALPQTDGGVFSPVLTDADDNAVGVVQLIARVTPGRPLLRAPDDKLSLEIYLGRGLTMEQSARLSSGIGVDVAGGPTFNPGRGKGESDTAPRFGIGLLGRFGGGWKVDEGLIGTATTTLMHGAFTTGGQLLTPATVDYEVVLHRAAGGSARAAFGPWRDGLRLLVPPADTMAGQRPVGGGVRALTGRLDRLDSIGPAELPFRVDSPELTALLDRAASWLRAEGFLPPTDGPAAGRFPGGPVLDEPARRARLAGLRRWSRFRTRLGLALAIPEAVDGGHHLFFERPATVGATRRVRLRLSARRDTGRRAEHLRRLPRVHPLGSGGYETGGARQRGTALSGYGGGGFTLGFPVADGRGTVTGGPDYTATGQRTEAVSVGDTTGLEQLMLAAGDGGDVFGVPLVLELDLYEGDDETPLIRFADRADEPGEGSGDDSDDDSYDAFDADGTGGGNAIALVPLGPGARRRGVPGTLSLLVRHHLTRPAAGAPAPAEPAAHVLRAPVSDATDRDDQRRLHPAAAQEGPVTSPVPVPVPGTVPLPAGSFVDGFRVTAAVMDALSRIAAGTYPGVPGPGPLARAARTTGAVLSDTAGRVGGTTRRTLELARQRLPVGRLGPVNDIGVRLRAPLSQAARTSKAEGAAVCKRLSAAALGAARNDPGTLAAEARQSAIRPGQLLARAQQILGGRYVVDALTLPGMLADEVLQVTIRGYLHQPRYLGDATLYTERSAISGGSAARQHGTGRTHQFTGGLTGLQSAPADRSALVHQFNPSLRHGYTRRNETADTRTAITKVTRVQSHTGPHHLIGAHVTLLITVRRGVRNVLGNTFGVGELDRVEVAVDLPEAITFLTPAAVLARYAHWYRFPGVTIPVPPTPNLPPPDDFARTGLLGLGTVLSLTQLSGEADGTGGNVGAHRAEHRDRLGDELIRLVEREAPGATRPGHSSYLPGVAPEIARRTEPAALQSLPGRGPDGSAFQFVHAALGGARLVEVALAAVPLRGTAALRELRGRPVTAAGIEQTQTHAPGNRATTRTVTRAHQTTAAPVSRFPRPGVFGRTDREGPALALTHQRARIARQDRTGEDRLWTRTDVVADFEGVEYVLTASVRSRLITEWPANVPGGVLRAGLLSFKGLEGTTAERLADWWQRMLAGRPDRRISVPASAVIRFAGSEAAPPHAVHGPLSPAVHTDDPVRTGPAPNSGPVDGTAGPVDGTAGRIDGTTRLVPTGPAPVFHFNGFPELVTALREVAPGTVADWGLPAAVSAEAAATRLGELVQAGRLTVDTPRTGAGLTPLVPGTRTLPGSRRPPVLSIAFYAPRPLAASADVAVDRVRRQGRGTTVTGSAGGAFALTNQGTLSLNTADRQLLAFSSPLAAQQPHTSGYGGSATGNRLNRLRTGQATTPADRAGTPNHQALTDVVITVEGPKGTRRVSGAAVVRLWENDVLGFGVTAARPRPGVYDVPALLTDGQRAADLRDWARHPLTDLPDALAAALDPLDPAARLWFGLGADPGGDRLAHAVRAAARTAARAGRPVEAVVRTVDGPRHWPFDANGDPTDTTQGTAAGWQAWRDAGTAHDDAVAAQRRAAALIRERGGESVAAAETLRIAEAAYADAVTTHEEARAAHTTAVSAADTVRGTGAESVAAAETVYARTESAVREAEALPTEQQVERAGDGWRRADGEARAAERRAPSATETVALRNRADAAHDAWRRAAELHEGRAAAVAAAHTARARAARALERAEAERDRRQREADAAMAEAARTADAAERAADRQARLRDADRDRLDGIRRELGELQAELAVQAARQGAALRELARTTRALDQARRAEGIGESGSLLGSLSAAPQESEPGPGPTGRAPRVRPAPPATTAPPPARSDRSAASGTTPPTGPPPAVAPSAPRRTDDGGAVLDGIRYAPHPVAAGAETAPEPASGRAAEAVVLAALGDRAPLAGLLPATEPDRSTAFRAWLATTLDGAEIADDQVPPLSPSARIPLPLLTDAGQVLTDAQRAQGTLLGDLLPAAEIAAGPAVRLRLLLADPAFGGTGTRLPLLPLLTAAAVALGVTAAVAPADGPLVRLPGGAPGPVAVPPPYVLLLHDGDRWIVLRRSPADESADESGTESGDESGGETGPGGAP